MKKYALLMIVFFLAAVLTGLAADKKQKAKRTMPCKAGMSCCKKMSRAAAKTKCEKGSTEKGKKTT